MKRLEVVPTLEAIADSIANNTAGRNDELVDLVKLIDSIDGPYSLLLDAPWGDGKTFFVRALEEVLKATNPQITPNGQHDRRLDQVIDRLEDIETPFLPFYFNAWENDFADDPISALFANMAVAFDAQGLTVAHSARKTIAAIVDAALAAAPIPVRISGIEEAITGSSLISAYEERAQLRSLIDDLAENCIKEVANKLVIIIDELDRCRPDFAVRLLEQTKSLFQSEKIIVIIATDSQQLAQAAAGLYGPGYDSQRFIERFYDQRLRLTPSEAFKVVEGHRPLPSNDKYDAMICSLLQSHDLTIRDYQRLREAIEAGRNYCEHNDGGSMIEAVSKCILIPLLIFLERDDRETFRKVIGGHDFDALYSVGMKHQAFREALSRSMGYASWPKDMNENGQMAPIDQERFVREICMWLYGDTTSTEYRKAAAITIPFPCNLDKNVFRTLKFPPECYKAQASQSTD